MSNPRSTILIAEDDDRTRQALIQALQAAGYIVIAVADGQAAIDYFEAKTDIALVVLDVTLPHLREFQVCQAIRAVSDVPIIIATVLGSASDRVTDLEMGANDYTDYTDYIVKPFSPKDLIARIRSILRRGHRRPLESPEESEPPAALAPSPHASHQIAHVGKLTIDPMTRRAYRGSHHLRLTEIEFRLLELLASQPGHIFSRGDILQSLWGYATSSAADTKTVDVHISRLRLKLDDRTRNPQFIVTIRSRGYMFLVQR